MTADARERMQALLSEVRTLEERVEAAGEAKRDQFEAQGKLLPRERVRRLVDPGAPLLELSRLAGLGMHEDDGERTVTGGGCVAAIGIVSGKRCAILANDSAIKGGTITPMGLRKTLRLQEIARRHRLPVIYLVESGGANLLAQSELFIEGGRSFANQARLSAAGLPQISVVHGSSTAGGAYLPGLSDYVVLVKKRSKIFLAGPPLVEAALGEQATEDELGGWALHAKTTGLGEFVATDDADAIDTVRRLVASLRWDDAFPPAEAAEPSVDRERLMELVPSNPRRPFDTREVMRSVSDRCDLLEFKPRYGTDTPCAYGRIGGRPVGFVGNNGPIMPQGATKAAQFIQLCDQTGTPLVFLQNTTGYMVGKVAEQGGAIKHGSKMIQAVANARVCKLTVVLGSSYGAGNYGMCGRGFDPNFIFSWPTARCAVMGGAQAARVMQTITREKFARRGQALDEDALQAMAGAVEAQLDRESTALFGTARLWDDGIIDPRDTRAVLDLCLTIAAEAEQRSLHPNRFGVARF
jgi:geranyl-CoA carboxylase beta subunit